MALRARENTHPDRLAELEARVDELTRALEGVQARLGALEHGPARPASEVAPAAEPPETEPVEREPESDEEPEAEVPEANGEALVHAAAIGGRTFLILGGAYLLRALTEGGVLPQMVGALVGLMYAGVWLFLAHRAAGQGRPALDSNGYGLAFALVAFPLLVEITTRFGLLSPIVATVVLGLLTGFGLFVARHNRLRALTWVILLASVGAAATCLVQTRAPTPFMLLLVAIGVAVDWVASEREWLPAQIAASAMADLAMLAYTTVVLVQGDKTWLTTGIQLSLFVAFMGAYVVRAQLEHRSLRGFERLQAIAVLVIGYLGAVAAVHGAAAALANALGTASLLAGLVGYAVAYFMFVRPAKDAVDAWFNTSYALVGILGGSFILLDEPAYAWTGIALVLTLLGTRDEYAALPLHGAVAALLAALAAGLGASVARAFSGAGAGDWPFLGIASLGAVAVSAVAFSIPLHGERTEALGAARAGKTLALTVVVAGVGVLAVTFLAKTFAGVGGTPDAARLASVRTAVLAVAALALALLSRVERFRDARLLVYPVLALTGLKIVLEDFPAGRPLTLFAAFAFYGVALIVAPRLRGRGRSAPVAR